MNRTYELDGTFSDIRKLGQFCRASGIDILIRVEEVVNQFGARTGQFTDITLDGIADGEVRHRSINCRVVNIWVIIPEAECALVLLKFKGLLEFLPCKDKCP